ncbi:hypothetical protein SDC9_168828 [bioreactor metagenome]|uniref:Uncharacterized protein n=1 Tax=bioreactor metagenome TaxID=1076179 RepID=A0A645G6K7_9ZZZZ
MRTGKWKKGRKAKEGTECKRLIGKKTQRKQQERKKRRGEEKKKERRRTTKIK